MRSLEAIADPVRLAMVRRLARGGPAGLPELAGAAAVHANTVRPHIAALERAGLVVRERTRLAAREHDQIRRACSGCLAPASQVPSVVARKLPTTPGK